MKRLLFSVLLLIFVSFQSNAKQGSFLILGDLHYDRLNDHDMNWLSTKPDDLKQVTKEYTEYTEKNRIDFMGILKQKIQKEGSSMKAIIQLGDLSEGLAGSETKARQMAGNAMKAIEDTNMKVPWIIAKGNHDVTGPGAVEAFRDYYIPMIRKQTKNSGIKNASYSCISGDVQFTILDPWDKNTDMVAFLEKELSTSKAKFNFVVIHEPVIPVTERCWHVLRQNPEQREKLLETFARHKAIVLTAHLHRYAVVCRNTPFGAIVQVMVNSVVRDRNHLNPSRVITDYGPSLAENIPDWQPETLAARKAMLAEEAKQVTFYKQTDLPGYAIVKTDSKKGTVQLEYYAFRKRTVRSDRPEQPFETVKISNT